MKLICQLFINKKAAVTLFATFLATTFLFVGNSFAQWKPKRPIEFVIMAGQGGGADRLARLIQNIIQQNKFSNQPFLPINKGGGSGAEALRYLKDKAGNPHVVVATLNSYYTTPLRNSSLGVDIKDFTPIARLALDTFLIWVHVDTGIKDLKGYISAVKNKGGKWIMGGTGSGQEDSLVTGMLEQEFGVKYTYIPFKGGGTVAKNLVGKHVNSTVNNPSEALGFLQAGKVRAIASFTPERLDAFKDVPTMKELGHDMTYFMQRSVVGPPNMPSGARDYYVSVFEKVHNSKQWKEYTTKKSLNRAFLTGQKLQDFFLAEREGHRKLLKKLGEIK